MDVSLLAEAASEGWKWTFNLFGMPVVLTPWEVYGFFGAALFSGRWFVQMYYSRKAGKPVTPRIFWVMSMAGSIILLTYFIFHPDHRDKVGILSNLFPAFIAGYNLYLDLTHAKRTAAAAASTPAAKVVPAPEAVAVNE